MVRFIYNPFYSSDIINHYRWRTSILIVAVVISFIGLKS